MKVAFLNSLSTKIFALVSVLVMATVAGNTYQASNQFRKIMTDLTKDEIANAAQTANHQISRILESWTSSVQLLMETNGGLTQKTPQAELNLSSFINKNAEYVSLHVHMNDATTGTYTELNKKITANLNDPRFDGLPQAEVETKLNQSVSDTMRGLEKDPHELTIRKAINTTLPILHLHLKYQSPVPNQFIFVTLSVWKTQIYATLQGHNNLVANLANRGGQVIAASSDLADRKKSLNHYPLFAAALKNKTSSDGLLEKYVNDEGEQMLGAFNYISKYRLLVLFEKEKSVAFAFVDQSFKRSLAYGSLFVLIALFLTYFVVTGVTRQLIDVTRATRRIAQGDFSVRIPMRSKDEVGVLSASVTYMAKRIVHLLHYELEGARTQKELETARMVQSTFFPKGDFNTDFYAISGFYQPAAECGGDLWGSFKVSEGKHAVFIADAMGHGVPAALLTAMAYSTYKTVESLLNHHDIFQDSPEKLLESLNSIIYDALGGKIHMTFFLCLIDFSKGKMTVANAGHNIPVLVPKNPEARVSAKAKKKKGAQASISLQTNGTPLGLIQNSTYENRIFDIEAGDKVVLFTDGLIECTNAKGDAWGRKVLIERIQSFSKLDAPQMQKALIGDAFSFFGGHPLKDDITIVVAEIHKLAPVIHAEPVAVPAQLPEGGEKRPVIPELTLPKPPSGLPPPPGKRVEVSDVSPAAKEIEIEPIFDLFGNLDKSNGSA